MSHAERARAAFERFDAANPAVYDLFKRFAMEALERGRLRVSGRSIVERIRWEMFMTEDGAFCVNNNYSPFYTRKFLEEHPQFARCFELRSSLADAA